MNYPKIYIVAPNIKAGGGKELLEYLYEFIRNNYPEIQCTIYADYSVDTIFSVDNITVVRVKGIFNKIRLFTVKRNNTLYFGNLPPIVRSSDSVLYIHNPYLVMDLKDIMRISGRFLIKFMLQKIYLRLFIENVDIIACQNYRMKTKISQKFVRCKLVSVIPFYRACLTMGESRHAVASKYDFCYISLGTVHKNHNILFDAIQILSLRKVSVSLVVTIQDSKNELLKRISALDSLSNVTVVNVGVVSKSKVCEVYGSSRCLIFPSLQETFGLPLVEAAVMGLDVIASNLDYVYEVVEPSLVFDPYSATDLANKMEGYLVNGAVKPEVKINNEIDELLSKFTHVSG